LTLARIARVAVDARGFFQSWFVVTTAFVMSTAAKVEVVQTGENRKLDGMIRRARRDGFVHVPAPFTYETRAQGQTPLALTESSPEAGVPLDGLDVAVATIHGRLEFVERDVFASTNEGFHGRTSRDILAAARKSGWHLSQKWLAPFSGSSEKWLAPFSSSSEKWLAPLAFHKCLAPF
jgi:hypothetical protein